MKTNLLALTLLCGIVLLLPSQNLHASGFFGGEIGYRCLGNEVYEITIRSYTECSGMQPDTGVLQATCGSVTVNASNYVKVSTRDITGVLSACKDSSKCKGGSFRYGFEEHVWKATLALASQSCCLWELGWTVCCRSGKFLTKLIEKIETAR